MTPVPRRTAPDGRPRDGRAQTGLDFVVGVGLFLLVLGFLVQFVPGMLAPYGDDASLPVTAERVATRLTTNETLLGGDPTTPGAIDRAATVAYFDAGVADPDGIAGNDSVNVTLEGDVNGDAAQDLLCWNGTALVSHADPSCDAGATVFAVGDEPPRDGSVAVVRRVVTVEGEDVTLAVRVWP